MNELEIKRLKAELGRVTAARLEMEVKLEELTQASARVQRDIEIQAAKEAELNAKLTQGEKHG